jgi:hypothetical protein
MRTAALLALLTAAACGSVADPTTGCTTPTVCARTCATEADDAEAWCTMRCGPCEPGDEARVPPLSFDGRACEVAERPTSEARPSTCWVTRRPWDL